ncbi:MAG: YybH family protein [Longimicrobiales bacterium]
MARPTLLISALVVLGWQTPASAQQHGQPPSAQDPAAAVKAAVDGFTAALQRGDSTAALEFLHPQLVVYEAGHAETREQYRSGHLGSDMAFLQAVAQETLSEQVVLGYDMATYLSEYTARGRFRDREIDAHGTETMVLVPTAEGWKIRHIHWSSR